ncbi:MAG: BMP family protein [Planctomycetota bacterium]
MIQKFSILLLAWAAFICACTPLLCGCKKTGDSTNANESFRVALLSPGPINDNGWNAIAWDGLLAIEKQLGALKSQQQVKPAEIEDGLRRNAQKGTTLIIGHGFEFGIYALKVAKEFPNVKFVVSAGASDVVAENVASMVWRIEDAAYLCGYIAAKLSKTGKAGCVGGVDIPPVRSAFDAFADGAKSVNPQFEVRQTYVNNWHDIGAARAQSLSLIAAGCDSLFHNADAAGLGMLEAAEQKKVLAFGCTKDQSSSAPNAVVASAIVDVPRTFVAVAEEVKDNKFRGRRIEWTRREDAIGLVWNEKLKSTIPADLIKEVAELDQKIKTGQLKIRYTAK